MSHSDLGGEGGISWNLKPLCWTLGIWRCGLQEAEKRPHTNTLSELRAAWKRPQFSFAEIYSGPGHRESHESGESTGVEIELLKSNLSSTGEFLSFLEPQFPP